MNHPEGAEREHRARATARVLLRGQGQAGPATSSPGGGRVFCVVAGVGAESVAPVSGWHWRWMPPQRFVVLTVSVLYRGCAIPLAWAILPATKKHAWRGEWLRLLRLLRPAIPRRMKVIVPADRGLYARWLFRRIVRLGWHPLLRINLGGQSCPDGQNRFQSLASFVPQPGRCYSGTGTAFATRACRLRCTLLPVRWEEGQAEPWLLLTDPARAARLWLAVATLWLLSVGGEAGQTIPNSTRLDPDPGGAADPRPVADGRPQIVQSLSLSISGDHHYATL